MALAGFEFLIDRSGQPTFLDYAKTIAFRRAEGQYVAPDKVFVKVRVIGPGLVAEVQIISIGADQWETNLLSGQWQASDQRYSFNPSRLFNNENGIQAILAHDLIKPTLTGVEELEDIPGHKFYVIQASLPGDRAYDMTYGMIDKDTLQAKLWIDPDRFDLYRVAILDPVNPGDKEGTTWQIDFWNFDGKFDIQKPTLNGK